MDRNFVLKTLSISDSGQIFLKHLKFVMWGQDLHFSAEVHSPDKEKITFEIHFLDCREMRWQIYTHIQETDSLDFPPTELVNFKRGRDQHRSPAHLLTEHFGLSLFYGTLEIIPIEEVIS